MNIEIFACLKFMLSMTCLGTQIPFDTEKNLVWPTSHDQHIRITSSVFVFICVTLLFTAIT